MKITLWICQILCLTFLISVIGNSESRESDDFDEFDRKTVQTITAEVKKSFGDSQNIVPTDRIEATVGKRISEIKRSQAAEKRWIEFRRKNMNFYGLVVDEQNNPVQDAEVIMTIENEVMIGKQFLQKKIETEVCRTNTNAVGRFVFSNKIGWRFLLKSIKAEGYEFREEKQPAMTFYPVTHPSQLKVKYSFRQSPKFPVVFVLKRIVRK